MVPLAKLRKEGERGREGECVNPLYLCHGNGQSLNVALDTLKLPDAVRGLRK